MVVESPSDAEALALAWIRAEWQPDWTPAIARVEDLGAVWRVSYNTAEYVETGAIVHALGGNHPLLIQKETGEVLTDFSALLARPEEEGETDYSVLSTRGGAQVVTAARALLTHLDALLGSDPGPGDDDLRAIRHDIAVLEAAPYKVRSKRTLAAMRLVRSWPKDDPVRQQVEHLNFLMQRPLP